MKLWYRDAKLSTKNLDMLDIINEIVEEYHDMGYRMTLRQLYYQLVSRDIIPNKDTEYSKLSTILKEGRMSGIVDWDAIEDRLRIPQRPYYVLDIEDALQDTINAYRLDRQDGQPWNLLVIVEKDALSNVLSPITNKYMIPLLVNRGYGSCTVLHELHKRFSKDERPGVIMYLGDHDPSGLDMIRDIDDRLTEFGTHVTMQHIALTWDQVESYNPPPNPAKVKDPRAKDYIAKYGHTSWEVDALRPPVLAGNLTEAIEANMDMAIFDELVNREEEHKKILRDFIEELPSTA